MTLPESATVGDLQARITEQIKFPAYDVRYGYPPKPLLLKDFEKSMRLAEMGIKMDGEQLIVSRSYTEAEQASTPLPPSTKSYPTTSTPAKQSSQKPALSVPSNTSFSFAGVGTAMPPPPPSTTKPPLSLTRKPNNLDKDAPELPLETHASTLLLRIMPDDNSCLFRAFNTAFFGAMDNMTELRSIIAQEIQANIEKYSAAVLDQAPDDYCRWIQTEDAWGGAIELDILSRHFDIEICSIDVQTLRTDRFNEGRESRCILVYSGIHYDTIALSPSDPPYERAYAPPEFDTKVFEAGDGDVLERAVDLCRVLRGRHYYTDTAEFSVKCNVCGTMVVGERGATEHATKTGHMDFREAG